MTDDDFLTMSIGRFTKGAALHHAILAIKGAAPPTGATPEVVAQRAMFARVMCSMLEQERNAIIELGIVEWKRAIANS